MLIYVKSKRFKHTLSLDMLIIRKNKQIVNLRETKLDHRNYLALNAKTCLQGFRPCKTQTNLLSLELRQNAEILRVVNLSIILSWKQTIKALIRLRGCLGWSAPLMVTCRFVRFLLDMVHKYDNVH